ncbi:MAG: hypothetical protein ACJAXW_000689 [Candidatus Azotimanducaceae bacterium]|jgi:hypothetical protein
MLCCSTKSAGHEQCDVTLACLDSDGLAVWSFDRDPNTIFKIFTGLGLRP